MERRNIRIGRSDVDPTLPSHVAGVREGNRLGAIHKDRGIEETSYGARGSAQRSTGINPGHHDTIDPRMPKLSPA
jgi:hypothetical protein